MMRGADVKVNKILNANHMQIWDKMTVKEDASARRINIGYRYDM